MIMPEFDSIDNYFFANLKRKCIGARHPYSINTKASLFSYFEIIPINSIQRVCARNFNWLSSFIDDKALVTIV